MRDGAYGIHIIWPVEKRFFARKRAAGSSISCESSANRPLGYGVIG